MKKTVMFQIAAILIGLMIASPAFAGPPPKTPPGPSGERLLVKLDLTHEQLEKVRQLKEAFLAALKPLKTKECEKRGTLDVLWMQMKPDAKRIASEQKALADIRYRITEQETAYRIGIRGILTEAQLTKLLVLGSDGVRPPAGMGPPPPGSERQAHPHN